MATKNKFLERYSSKILPVYIPLSEFSFFHSASSEEEIDKKFIGRKKITRRLISWLTTGTRTGVYLITGFRGMGKSSFVGKVLNDIAGNPDKQKKKNAHTFRIIALWVIAFIAGGFIYPVFGSQTDSTLSLWLTFILISFAILFYYRAPKNKNKPDKHYIPIKLNLGHETLNERDILSLISNSIEHQYEKFYKNLHYRPHYYLVRSLAILISASVLAGFTYQVISEQTIHIPNLLRIPNQIFKEIRNLNEVVFDIGLTYVSMPYFQPFFIICGKPLNVSS